VIYFLSPRGLASVGKLFSVILGFLLAFLAAFRNGFSAVAALLIALTGAALIYILMTTEKKHIRGKSRFSYTQARETARRILDHRKQRGIKEQPFNGYGGISLPATAIYKNFLFLGNTGTGKTLQMYLLMYAALAGKPKVKAVLHDVKMELAPFLIHIGIDPKRIKLIMPYDQRGYRWDIQKDVGNDDLAWDVARSFVPDTEDKRGEFFVIGARILFYNVIRYFTYEARKNPHFRWGLRDLFQALCNSKDLRAMFEKYPDDLSTGLEYLEGENKDITRTMLKYIMPLNSVAALWEGRPPFSFTQWRDTPNGDIVILGFDDDFEEQCSILNATLFRRAMKAVLSYEGENRPDTWFFIDEFDSLRAIPGLANFLSKSRSFKACVAIVLQSFRQLRKNYDDHHEKIIPELCANKIILQCTDESADWASRQCGSAEIQEEGTSDNFSAKGGSTGVSRKPTEKRIVMKDEIEGLPIFDEDGKIHCYFVSAYLRNNPYYYAFTRTDLAPIWMQGGNKQVYEKVKDPLAYNLPAWTDTDRKRAGLPLKNEQQPEQKSESETQSVNESEDDIPFWRPRTGRD